MSLIAFGVGHSLLELDQIEATLANEVAKVDFRELLEPRMTRVLTLGIFLAVFQQWCGINVIFNYAEEVYRGAGYGVSDILFNIVVTGSVNLLFTLVALGFVDRFGRRPLMLFGCAGIAVLGARRPSASTAMSTADACACFAAFVSASEAT